MGWGKPKAPETKPLEGFKPNIDHVGAVYREYYREVEALGNSMNLRGEALFEWQNRSEAIRRKLKNKLSEFGLASMIDMGA